MAAITTSRTAVAPDTSSTRAGSGGTRPSSSALRGLLLAVPAGAGMWILLVSLGRHALS